MLYVPVFPTNGGCASTIVQLFLPAMEKIDTSGTNQYEGVHILFLKQ